MKVKSKKILAMVVAIVTVIVFLGYNYLYQDHRDIQSEEIVTVVTADDLAEVFAVNPSHEYLNQTVQVSGVISEIDSIEIVLSGKVHCTFLNVESNLKLGDLVNVKGRCIGYDELFEIVKLDQCSLINQ